MKQTLVCAPCNLRSCCYSATLRRTGRPNDRQNYNPRDAVSDRYELDLGPPPITAMTARIALGEPPAYGKQRRRPEAARLDGGGDGQWPGPDGSTQGPLWPSDPLGGLRRRGVAIGWFTEAIDPEKRRIAANIRPVSFRGRQPKGGREADTASVWGISDRLAAVCRAKGRSFPARSPCHGPAIRHELDESGR